EPQAAPPATTASGLTVRRRTKAPVAARRTAEPAAAGPGRPAVAAAWAEGTRRGRQDQPSPTPAGTDAAHRTAPGPGPDAAHDAAPEEGH
ncbi:hypothetical protein AB0L50_11150, partial [Streptomyces flaveolus]